MEKRPQDKRLFERVNLRTSFRYQLRGTPYFNNAVTDNISIGGLGVVIPDFVPTQTIMMLDINIMSRFIKAIGKVVWVTGLPRSSRSRMGLQFIEMDYRDREYLSEYLRLQHNVT